MISLDGSVTTFKYSTSSASITIGNNSNRLLIVTYGTYQGSGPSGITWNGVSLTKIVEKVGSFNEKSSIWGLVAPATGTHTLSVSGMGNWSAVGVYSLYGCVQSLPTNVSSIGGAYTTMSISITTTQDKSWVIAQFEAEAAITMTTTSGTEDYNQAGASYQHAEGQHIIKNTLGFQTMTASLSYGSRANATAIEVVPLVPKLSMRVYCANNNKLLDMRVRAGARVDKSLSMKVRCRNLYVKGRLSDLAIRAIDNQKFSKDVLKNQPADALYTNIINAVMSQRMNINYVSNCALIDPTSSYPAGFTPSPRTAAGFNQAICDIIHGFGLKVIHRMTSMAMEGKANFPEWPSVPSLPIGHKSDIIPIPTTDSFSRSSLGANYIATASGGGIWIINNGKVVLLTAGNEFSYNIAHRVESFTDGTFQVDVEKGSFGHDGIIVCGGNKSTTPFIQGFGIHMSGTNTLSLEDVGARNISADTRSILTTDTSTSFTTGHLYTIKVVKSGTSLKIKVWDTTGSEPGSYQIDTTSSLYANGWFGMTSDGFGKNVHFDNLSITPSQNLNSFMGMVYSWMVNNPDSFADNDIIAPFPEFDTCQGSPNMCYFITNRSWLHTGYNSTVPVTFFNELKDVEDYAASQIGKRLKTGYTGPNASSVASFDDPGKKLPNGGNDLDYKDANGNTIYDKAKEVVADFYGTTYVSNYNPTGASHPAQEIYDWSTLVAAKHKYSVFFQEFGGYVPINLSDVSTHDLTFRGYFNKMADAHDTPIPGTDKPSFNGLSYYGFADTGDADTGILHNSGTNYSTAYLRVKGQVLRDFYQPGLPTYRSLSLRVKRYIVPTVHTLSLRVYGNIPTTHGRLKNLPTRCVDFMKNQRDTVQSQFTDKRKEALVEFAYESLNLTHLAYVFPLDPISWYPVGFTPYPDPVVTTYQKWVNLARDRNLKIKHRALSFGMEGDFGFLWRVGANRYPVGTVADVVNNVDRNSWLGIVYDFIVNNPTLFADGDEWAPFPERTEHLFEVNPDTGLQDGYHSFLSFDSPGITTNYANFFIAVKQVSDIAFQAIGKNVVTGDSTDNYSEVRSQYIPSGLYNVTGIVAFDYYQNYNSDGFGKDALSEDIDSVYYARNNKPIDWQEWGSTPDMIRNTNSGMNAPDGSEGQLWDGSTFHPLSYYGLSAHPENRVKLFTDVLNTVADKADKGIITRFNYWGWWDTGDNDSGLIRISGNPELLSSYSLRLQGQVVQDFYENDVYRPPVPPPLPPPPSTQPTGPISPTGWSKPSHVKTAWSKVPTQATKWGKPAKNKTVWTKTKY